jgi:hypothetical protein
VHCLNEGDSDWRADHERIRCNIPPRVGTARRSRVAHRGAFRKHFYMALSASGGGGLATTLLTCTTIGLRCTRPLARVPVLLPLSPSCAPSVPPLGVEDGIVRSLLNAPPSPGPSGIFDFRLNLSSDKFARDSSPFSSSACGQRKEARERDGGGRETSRT